MALANTGYIVVRVVADLHEGATVAQPFHVMIVTVTIAGCLRPGVVNRPTRTFKQTFV